jgi:uncharacterized protein (DUF934 family)
MHKPIVIEVSGEPLGVVIPSGEGFRFMAVRFPVFSIDGQVFSSVAEARMAAGFALEISPDRDAGQNAAA